MWRLRGAFATRERFFWNVRRTALAAVALWITAPAGAAAAQEWPDSVLEVQGITAVGTRAVGEVGGASGATVSPDSMVLPAVATLEDALRDMPFVLIRQNSRGMAELSVRGSDSRQVAVLLDGVPLSIAWDHRTDPSVIPLLGVENLSLVRGLPSLLSGPNVLGGVVEVDVGRGASASTAQSGMRATAGWDDAGYRALGAGGTWAGDMAGRRMILRSGIGVRSRDGVALPGGVVDSASHDGLRTNSYVEGLSAYGAMRFEGALGSWLSLSGSGHRAERGVPPELHVSSPRLWRIPEEWQAVAALSAGTGHHPTPFGEGDLEISLGFNTGGQDVESFSSLAYDELVETESGEDRTLTLRLLGDHTLGSAGELRGAFTYADVRHLEAIGAQERNEYHQRLWSFGSETAWRLPADTRFTVGGAVDGADTPESGGRPQLGGLSAIGARVGLSTLALREDLQLHGSVSSRARFPALRELYSGALGRFDPNPSLGPERLNAAELGATWKPGRAEVQATVFRHRLEDAVVRITTPEGLYRRVNRDEINSTGFELLLGTSWRGAEITGDLMLQNVSLRDKTDRAGPLRPEHMPEIVAGLDLNAPLPFDIRGLLNLQRTGSQYCIHPDLASDMELSASTRVDIGARRSWKIGRGPWRMLRATATMDNAADAAAYDQCGMPRSGRTLRLGLEIL